MLREDGVREVLARLQRGERIKTIRGTYQQVQRAILELTWAAPQTYPP